MIAAPGAPLLAAQARHDEVRNPGTIRRYPIPAHRKQMEHWRYQPSQHDSDLPAERITLIDLSCTPEEPGIHPPVDLCRPRVSPSDHADASDSAE